MPAAPTIVASLGWTMNTTAEPAIRTEFSAANGLRPQPVPERVSEPRLQTPEVEAGLGNDG